MRQIWQFRSLLFDRLSGQIILTELSDEQEKRVGDYEKALFAAQASRVPSPRFSEYHVRTGVGLTNYLKLQAGNVEYGLCQALHGEESAVAAFRSTFGGKMTRRMILGFIESEPGQVGSPCGNCRDILLDMFGANFEIVSGSERGGIAVVANMSDFLFENYDDLTEAFFSREEIPEHFSAMTKRWFRAKVREVTAKGRLLTSDVYSPKHMSLERHYYALVVTGQSEYFGGLDLMCDYHPIYPLRDAVRQARRASDPFVRFVIIVRADETGEQPISPPHVMYRDRQHLLEMHFQGEMMGVGGIPDPPVYLATQRKGRLLGVWKTSVKEWLPLPFTPHCFGDDFLKKFAKYFRTKRRLYNRQRR